MEIFYKKNNGVYPKPSDSIVISYTGVNGQNTPFSYLGYVKNSIGLDFNEIPRDPMTSDYYAYGATVDKKYYEVAATLENDSEMKKTSFFPIPSASAAGTYDDNDEYAYILGNYNKGKTSYIKHLILAKDIGDGRKEIPRTDVNIGTFDGTQIDVSVNFSILDHGGTNVPYPIRSRNFISTSLTGATSDFTIEVATGVSLSCPDCN